MQSLKVMIKNQLIFAIAKGTKEKQAIIGPN